MEGKRGKQDGSVKGNINRPGETGHDKTGGQDRKTPEEEAKCQTSRA